MYNCYRSYQCPYYTDISRYNQDNTYYDYYAYSCSYPESMPMYAPDFPRQINRPIQLKDYGPQPFVVNINKASKQNNNFRTALWTGNHLQVTLMSIKVGDDIGLENHPNIDQFIRIEDGQGIVRMGRNKDRLDFQARVYDGIAIMIPAGTWHNIINTGNRPLKVYSIYAPPQHPHGVVHVTKPRE